MSSGQVRKFTDDDFRRAVKLLEVMGGDLDAALSTLAAARSVLESLDYDFTAAKQLVIVTDSFRDVLGLKARSEPHHGECVKAS